MYNACTIMYTHLRSQASDWNCCVKRLFVCTTERERERARERERDIVEKLTCTHDMYSLGQGVAYCICNLYRKGWQKCPS